MPPEPALLFQSGPPGHASTCSVISSTCDVRAASWARCFVPPLSRLALSKLASRAPDAQESALLFQSGPSGHASPCKVLCPPQHAKCVRPRGPAATSCRSPRWRSPRWRPGFRVPWGRPCSSSLAHRAKPRRAKFYDLLGMRRARCLVDLLRHPTALHAGALQAGVSGSGCSGAGPGAMESAVRLKSGRPGHASTCTLLPYYGPGRSLLRTLAFMGTR